MRIQFSFWRPKQNFVFLLCYFLKVSVAVPSIFDQLVLFEGIDVDQVEFFELVYQEFG